MKLQKLLILLIIIVSLYPAWMLSQWLQKIIQPRRSFGRLTGYILLCFALVFLYTFLLVYVISNLFPVPKG